MSTWILQPSDPLLICAHVMPEPNEPWQPFYAQLHLHRAGRTPLTLEFYDYDSLRLLHMAVKSLVEAWHRYANAGQHA